MRFSEEIKYSIFLFVVYHYRVKKTFFTLKEKCTIPFYPGMFPIQKTSSILYRKWDIFASF
ncbi:hypothetical protein BSBH6_00069 [Bacillus subtilis]|nr:hypothetical protein BSBH6_00069 [Bacillus subtilis]RPK26433.1 hypothetical protein BH5_00068 [Bacillus subtilis]